MKIVIVGGGKVGEFLCVALSTEGNDVILIEKNSRILERIVNKTEIIGIVGNGANYDVQIEANVPECDVFIAVTEMDEINMIASIIAKKLGAKNTILRARNREYSSHIDFVRESLGITMLINPELEAAKHMANLIKFPSALSVESFVYGRVNMVELEINEKSKLANINLVEFKNQHKDIMVMIVLRGEEAFIPFGESILQKGDRIYVTGGQKQLNKFYKAAGSYKEKIRSVMIIGGGRITYYLLSLLAPLKLNIKVIEHNEEKAIELSSHFPEVVVINGDGTDQTLLDEERMEMYDAVISLTGVDEENVINSMYAAKKDVKKIITKINRISLMKILGSVGLQSVITPKQIIANSIIRFVRSLEESEGSDVEALYRLAYDQVEVLQFKVKESSKIINIPLSQLNTKNNLLIAYIIRKKKVIFPDGKDVIKPKDYVVVVSSNSYFNDIDDIREPNKVKKNE
ncbi:trk system potassium uptake protein TrkA [Carnobacterium iners]|uniref:Trk system potassium uptake protein TrkA n=1 Tax=Carnobacterium iners TaxID=1073423 RepID=A0A1X7N4R1_9LACT|nr:Trk system potassium transporter TrkA [Carnobacterium iners]SEL30914.1 trk system potassium uptake protein TrkA [Carnobacterium iners]SMH32397.1 trk system potassium uptake protein TrkA [Carnobacterium iners]